MSNPLDPLSCWSPVIQGGFAVFSLVLLAVVVWLIRALLRVIEKNNQVIAGNTEAIRAIGATSGRTEKLLSELRDQLLTRPCMIPNEHGECP